MKQVSSTQTLTSLQTQFLQDLIALLTIKSVRDDKTVSQETPVGIGNRQALDFMFALAKRDGFTYCNVDNIAGHIEFGDGDEIVGIIGHLDVVPADNNWTVTAPFAPLLHDGFLYARGVSDDKGPVMAAYYAMKQLKEQGVRPNKRIRLILGTDEESQWQCMQAYFAKQPKPNIGFSPDARFPIVNSEKGSVSMQITVDACDDQFLLQFHSGEKRNVVPDNAIAIVQLQAQQIDIMQESFANYLAEQQLSGEITYDLTAKQAHIRLNGYSCHGSEPQLGKNAGTYLANWLYQFAPNNTFLSLVRNYFHLNYHGMSINDTRLGLNLEEKTIKQIALNIGVFRYQLATLAASLQINFRYPDSITQGDLQQWLAGIIPAEANWQVIGQPKAPHFVSESSPLVRSLKAVYTHVTGQEAYCLTSGGGTFARLFDNCVGFGALFPHNEDTMHQINEKSAVADLFTTIVIYTQAIQELMELK